MTDQIPLLEHDPSARRGFDYYPTAPWMTRALLKRMSYNFFGPLLEPCSGEDAIANVLRDAGYQVHTNDLDPSRPARTHFDMTKAESWKRFAEMERRPYWAVTNKPFDLADVMVPLAIEHGFNLATVLRLSWLEPTAARQRFLEKHPPTRLIVMPRHDFRGNGSTDSVTSAWFIWDDNGAAKRGVDVVTKAERDEWIARLKKEKTA